MKFRFEEQDGSEEYSFIFEFKQWDHLTAKKATQDGGPTLLLGVLEEAG